MANMSYCRFRNTLSNLRDAYYNIPSSLDGEEFQARLSLIELCKSITEEWDGFKFVEGEDENEEEEEEQVVPYDPSFLSLGLTIKNKSK